MEAKGGHLESYITYYLIVFIFNVIILWHSLLLVQSSLFQLDWLASELIFVSPALELQIHMATPSF